jgi:hypothetical protein
MRLLGAAFGLFQKFKKKKARRGVTRDVLFLKKQKTQIIENQ